MKKLASMAAALLTCGLSLVTVSTVTAGPADAATVPYAANGTVVKKHLLAAIKGLPKAGETPVGYDRDKFTHWVDANHDCQDTRSEVLRQENRGHITGSCTVTAGRWVSYYDDLTFTRASELDVDHLVPLAEAWKSGAKRWGADRREAYANDLGDPRTLVAVSAHANRSKGDRDPSQWMPEDGDCTYLQQWVAVKVRWSLKANRAEKAALRRLVRTDACGNPVVTVRLAVVRHSSTGGGGGTTGGGGGGGTTGGGGGGGGGLDPRFGTCTEAKAHGYGPYYRGVDPEYAWYRDADSDGIVCE